MRLINPFKSKKGNNPIKYILYASLIEQNVVLLFLPLANQNQCIDFVLKTQIEGINARIFSDKLIINGMLFIWFYE